MTKIRPFEAKISDAALAELHAKLRTTRWIKDGFGGDWGYGAPLSFVQALCDHWLNRFDWRALEARINALTNLIVPVEGHDIHCVHQRSSRGEAIPLLLVHGWPGSFLEFMEVYGPLTAPPAGEPAFHVVTPSLPGYGFSSIPTAPGMTPQRIAGLLVQLMESLGYQRFIVQGGDWGSVIATEIARRFPERCLGLHLNMVGGAPPPNAASTALSAEEQVWVADYKRFQAELSGYFALQSTKPATPAHALNDSPAGLAAWIGEKFYYWTDHRGSDELLMPLDMLVGNIALYWFTGTIGSSMRIYYEFNHDKAEPRFVTVPTGGAIFPKEIVKLPRPWAEAAYNIVQWTVHDRGGHFAAMEAPALLVDDIRRFAKVLGAPEFVAKPNEKRIS